MSCFPDDIKFCFPWRPYQQRILDASQQYVADWHFHVVAAPGSGKTVLGLELLLRLDRPTLIFAPSLGIRDQWIRRFCDLFLPQPSMPDWISTDLMAPGIMTVITYQSLGACMKKHGVDQVMAKITEARIETLVLDEAHHLRKFWWACLIKLKDGLSQPVTISLTATPPYDVNQVEWNRYMKLCGEVDEEISVAELVKEKNLCPHQDYIYFCQPKRAEIAGVRSYHQAVESVLKDLGIDEAFVSAIQQWPPVAHPSASIDELSKCNEFALSVAVYLRFAHGVVPPAYLWILGLDEVDLPTFNRGWGEVLLNGVLFQVGYFRDEVPELCRSLLHDLQRIGAIYKKRVLLNATASQAKALRSSVSKLESISEIIDVERRTLKEQLRLVVLTDFIRLEDFPSLDRPDCEVERMGVVPIFEHVRRLRLQKCPMGILTGKVVVIPTSVLPMMRLVLLAKHLPEDLLQAEPLVHDPNYLRVSLTGGENARLVEIMTDLFQVGEIQVLIGTTALLGEGWDAPAMNSLILATVVGSYMSTNQIRGRAIRTCPEDPDKTANIWHLACVQRTMKSELWSELPPTLMDDMDLLKRRFDTFTGVSTYRLSIENGLARMGLSHFELNQVDVGHQNKVTVGRAEGRYEMSTRWQEVFDHLGKLPGKKRFRPTTEIFVPDSRVQSTAVARLLLRPRTFLTNWLRTSARLRRVRRTAEMLNELMVAAGQIEAGGLVTVSEGRKDVLAQLRNVPQRDEAVFMRALAEIYNPLLKPRYLIRSGGECYAVPQAFAVNKAEANRFFQAWRKNVARGQLIYTNNKEGRLMLLQARQKYLATRHHDVVRSHQVVS